MHNSKHTSTAGTRLAAENTTKFILFPREFSKQRVKNPKRFSGKVSEKKNISKAIEVKLSGKSLRTNR